MNILEALRNVKLKLGWEKQIVEDRTPIKLKPGECVHHPQTRKLICNKRTASKKRH